jgi:TonB family protein
MPTWDEERQTEPEVHRGLLVRGPHGSASIPSGEGQHRRMMAALGILAVALILVVAKDWQFWFPSSPSAPPVAENMPPADDGETEITTMGPNGMPVAHAARQRQKMPAVSASGTPQDASATSSGPTITATQRTVLPPLEVEVVAGGQHRTVQPRNNSVKVDLNSDAMPAVTTATPSAQVSTDITAAVHLSPETAQVLSRPVEPSYPLLAKQMKVQGAVVLEALIGKQGTIEDLRVLSGPAILSSAAMEAVKQWRFKPYFQNGRAVETQARITVNFTISTY